MRAARALAALVVSTAALAAGAAEADVTVDVALEQKTVRLGEDAVLLVSLTNHTASALGVPAIRVARDAVSVRVAPAGLPPATVTRLYGTFLEDEAGELGFRATPTRVRLLAAGETLTGRVTVPALLAGNLSLTVLVGDAGPARLEAKPVTVEVVGRQRAAVEVETTRGALRIDLDAAAAYAEAANFWTLAKDGFFDGLPFHRVLPGVLAQTGDPQGTGTGGPGWYLPGGAVASTASRGDVGFARGAHPDSAGSQWFVVTDAKNTLGGGYARIGTIGDGLATADQLTAPDSGDPKAPRPRTPDRVVTAKPVAR